MKPAALSGKVYIMLQITHHLFFATPELIHRALVGTYIVTNFQCYGSFKRNRVTCRPVNGRLEDVADFI